MIDIEEFNRILKWVASNIDSDKISLEDKFYIIAQVAAFVNNIKPIYDKYNNELDKLREDLINTINNMFESEVDE